VDFARANLFAREKSPDVKCPGFFFEPRGGRRRLRMRELRTLSSYGKIISCCEKRTGADRIKQAKRFLSTDFRLERVVIYG
jgi:hypothetical protein